MSRPSAAGRAPPLSAGPRRGPSCYSALPLSVPRGMHHINENGARLNGSTAIQSSRASWNRERPPEYPIRLAKPVAGAYSHRDALSLSGSSRC